MKVNLIDSITGEPVIDNEGNKVRVPKYNDMVFDEYVIKGIVRKYEEIRI